MQDTTKAWYLTPFQTFSILLGTRVLGSVEARTPAGALQDAQQWFPDLAVHVAPRA